MAINHITCPKCRGGLNSSSGFQAGETVSCPKCETAFVVEQPTQPTDDEEFTPNKQNQGSGEPEWSYKNSWMRYAVLGVLVVVLGVLGYMLYDKKQKEKEEVAGSEPQVEEGKPLNPVIVGGPKAQLVPLPPPGAPNGGGGRPAPIPKTSNPTVEEMKQRLVGKWETGKGEGSTHTVEYKADGGFTFTVGSEPPKTVTGKWTLTEVDWIPVGKGGQLDAHLRMEWVADGKTLKDIAFLRVDGQLRHPLLNRKAEGSDAAGTFTKK